VTAPHDRPTAEELVAVVRQFLENEVLPATEGSVRFHTRVSVNALGIAEREMQLGPEHALAHAERLAHLGYSSDGELAAAIRAGELDDRWMEVKAAVAEAVRDKLLVANPDYLDR
jgi:hypothetical protein